jgi:hypothetical protein
MTDKITVGKWSWDPELLMSKIIKRDTDDCWGWSGSVAPHANLMGARKNNRPQMTQAPRLIWMTHTGQDVSELEVRHHCGNRFCTNISHMFTKPNHMRYHKDGRLLGQPPSADAVPEAKKFKPVDLTPKTQVKRQPWWQL